MEADALDRAAVDRAVRAAAPDAVVNLLTAIPANLNPKKLATDFALTNRLRTEGTRNLYDAARAAGAKRVVSQGLAYGYQPDAGLADEDAPLWTVRTPSQFAPVLAALVELEQLTAEAGGLVLRFGHLYGPGSGYAADGSFTGQVRAGKVPLVGGGNAVFSFTHADDAASAIVAALDRNDVTGALNVVDESPARLHEWLPAFAAMLNAPAPKRAPAVLARLPAARQHVGCRGRRCRRLSCNDGGGKVRAARVPIVGRDHVLAFVAGLMARYPIQEVRQADANGAPAVWTVIGGQEQLVTLDIRAGRIRAIYGILNPDKLGHVRPVSD